MKATKSSTFRLSSSNYPFKLRGQLFRKRPSFTPNTFFHSLSATISKNTNLWEFRVPRRPGVNFINTWHLHFSYKSERSSFFLVTFWLCNFLAPKYWQKKCALNVDEIGVNFTNIIMSSFYALMSQKCKKTTDDLAVFFVHLGSVSVKVAHKMLMKLNQ
jgi:hypothetical protein